jgi:Mg2+ and Co2+ transporter CorA
MAQATKSPETVKGTEAVKTLVEVKSQVVEQSQEVVANLSETLLNTFSEGLESAYAAQKKLEDQFLEALNNQEIEKVLGKLSEDVARLEEEQKKFYDQFRESTKQNVAKVFGETAGNAVEQYFAQFDGVTNYLQDLNAQSTKECLNFVRQSQEQIKQTVQSNFEQQQKIRDEFKTQIKSAQQLLVDFYENNTKAFFNQFK